MTTEQWEALATRAAKWSLQPRHWERIFPHSDREAYIRGPIKWDDLALLGWFALFARLMSVAMKPAGPKNHPAHVTCQDCITAGGICGDCADCADEAVALVIQGPAQENVLELLRTFRAVDLMAALRAYHAGNPSALDRLLCEAWGERPAKPQGPICLCPATSEYDPPCPKHGVLGIGVMGQP